MGAEGGVRLHQGGTIANKEAQGELSPEAPELSFPPFPSPPLLPQGCAPLVSAFFVMGKASSLRRYRSEAMIMPVVVRPRPICGEGGRRRY